MIELRSKSDRLFDLQQKMLEYIDNGARLGWLIDPYEKQVYVYRTGREMELLQQPETINGEDVLPGFQLSLANVW